MQSVNTYVEISYALFIQVISEFPQLKGHERDLDGVLGKSLIQAKHYQMKKSKKVVSFFHMCQVNGILHVFHTRRVPCVMLHLHKSLHSHHQIL